MSAPVGRLAEVSESPEKRNGRNFSSACSAPSTLSAMSSPSMTVMIRSMPGKGENGPALATSAMLMRQSQVAPDSAGPAASCRVTPPPLAQGAGLSEA